MNKTQEEVKTQSNTKPVRKLRPLKPVNTSAKPVDNKEKPVPKKPEVKKSESKKPEKPAPENKKSESKKTDKPAPEDKRSESKKPEKAKPEKKGFFESVKDMMYASADDDNQEENEETKTTLENISEVLAEINDELPIDKSEKTKEEPVKATEEKQKTEQVKDSGKKNKNKNKSQQKNNSADNKKPEEKTETVKESKPEESEKPKTPEETTTENVMVEKVKYHFIKLLSATFVILIILVGIRSCFSGKTSSDEKYRQAIYPAVITDINSFENPSELPVSQILSTAVWSVIIDSEKLSGYPQRVDDMAIIPAEDIEKYATEIFGEDIPELTHSTILTSDSKFYYNEEANSYTVEVSPHTVTYTPEVTSVSKRNGKYIVEVNYIDQHPEWIEDTVSKTAEYVLSKNGDGYMIESMHETSTTTETTTTEATTVTE